MQQLQPNEGHRGLNWVCYRGGTGVIQAMGHWVVPRSAVVRSLSSGNGMSKDGPFKWRRVRILSVFVWVDKVLAGRISVVWIQ